MEPKSDRTFLLALAVAVVALVLSVTAYTARGKTRTVTLPPTPATVRLSMVVATFSGQGMAAHRWFPTMLVVRQGDTVDLAVANPDRVSHRFELTGYGLRTRTLTPGSSQRLRFVADRPGVYVYQCILPHDPAQGHCTPDHHLMLGYLLVTD